MAENNLAYLMLLEEEGTYMGGLRVTDLMGLPLEFKYTDPITPTALQQILYGKVLRQYLRDDILVRNLLREIKTVPSMIVVPEPEYLSGRDKAGRTPMVSLQKTTLPFLKTPGEIQRVKETEAVFQPFQDGGPLRLTFGAADPERQERALLIVKEVGRKRDLSEPLERVEKALRLLWQNHRKESAKE